MIAPILLLLLDLSPPPLAIPLVYPSCSPIDTGCQSFLKAHRLKSWGQAFHISMIKMMKLHLREGLSQDPTALPPQQSREWITCESLRETQGCHKDAKYPYTVSASQQRGLHLCREALCVCVCVCVSSQGLAVVSVPRMFTITV